MKLFCRCNSNHSLWTLNKEFSWMIWVGLNQVKFLNQGLHKRGFSPEPVFFSDHAPFWLASLWTLSCPTIIGANSSWSISILCMYLLLREGNGNPLQYFCLENSMDRGAWWGYSLWGQSQTRLSEKHLSSGSASWVDRDEQWTRMSTRGPRWAQLSQSCLTLRPHGLQCARPPCPSPTPRVYLFIRSVSVLPMNIQGWFPLGWTGWLSLQCKGLSPEY